MITYSSGNHAQAVAFAARRHGIRAAVVMPTTAPRVKSDSARWLGVQVEFAGTTRAGDQTQAQAAAFPDDTRRSASVAFGLPRSRSRPRRGATPTGA